MTHYEVLGVEPTASPADIRRAYVARARLLHPDRRQGAPAEESARTARAMQDVNEAWRVLRAPASRSAYDASLAARSAGPAGRRRVPADGDIDLDPTPYHSQPAGAADPVASVLRSLPWLAVLFVLGVIFVVTAFAGASDEGRQSTYDLVGRCVQSQQGVGIVEVPCTSPNEGRVDLVVNRQGQCPDDAVARGVPGEAAWVCLRPVE